MNDIDELQRRVDQLETGMEVLAKKLGLVWYSDGIHDAEMFTPEEVAVREKERDESFKRTMEFMKEMNKKYPKKPMPIPVLE